MKRTTTAKPVLLPQIIAECENPTASVHYLPERATWFATMLRNAIANQRDTIEFAARHTRQDMNLEHHYNCIMRCEAALRRIGFRV